MNNMTQEKKEILLPPPELLERYESISKGLSKDLVEIVKKEQMHRHELQDKYLFHFRLGQLFGSLFLLATIYGIFDLAKSGHCIPAYIMMAIFGLLIVLILAQYKKDKSSAIIRNSSRATSQQNRRTSYKRNYTKRS